MHQRHRNLVLIFLTCIFSIGFPSCGEDYVAFRDIEEVGIYDLETKNVWLTPTTTSSDSLALRVLMRLSYFTFTDYVPDIMNEAWATSPEDPILANEITDIRVYSNDSIFGIPAGNNLISEMLIGYSLFEKFTPDYFIEQLPEKGDRYAIDIIYLFFQGKPIPGSYTFTVEIEDNNGHVFISSAPEVHWQ